MDADTLETPYDYESVMQYPFNAFAIDKNFPTMVPKKKGSRLGQTINLSLLDALRIQKAYSCGIPDPARFEDEFDQGFWMKHRWKYLQSPEESRSRGLHPNQNKKSYCGMVRLGNGLNSFLLQDYLHFYAKLETTKGPETPARPFSYVRSLLPVSCFGHFSSLHKFSHLGELSNESYQGHQGHHLRFSTLKSFGLLGQLRGLPIIFLDFGISSLFKVV